MRLIFAIALGTLLTVTSAAQDQKIVSGMIIKKSVTTEAKACYLPAIGDENGKASIVVQGDNITVDFNNALVMGTPVNVDPDERKGVGIEVRGKNVTIKNLKIRGYKVALIARNCPGLKIVSSDFSENWKQRLLSTTEQEDESDWMSYHQNEKDEWLRYGAGIYLRDCDGFEIKGNKAQGGQCGLMMTNCNKGVIWNNDFSFLSAIGVGMYRSSDNRIMHNKIDWCVRGYSHGVYNRGQDSAGILIYEQSNKNVFAYNSVTHGGDGFFLWAGQTTMDTGKGGCNDNLVYGNDFSHSPTNGIEATFSRNLFANNLVMECWHGVWGGYSFESKVLGNLFAYNANSIAWEHGQDNQITANSFYRDNAGIDIWANASEDPNWGYAKARNTKSHDWLIKGNTFSNLTTTAIKVRDTNKLQINKNTFIDCKSQIELQKTVFEASINGDAITKLAEDPTAKPLEPTMQPSGNPVDESNLDQAEYLKRFDTTWSAFKATNPAVQALAPKPMTGGANPFLASKALRGRRYILVDEWGPYDFKTPRLVLRGKLPNGLTRFEVLGPYGKWEVKKAVGVTPASVQGKTPAFLDVKIPPNTANIDLQLMFVGVDTYDYRGMYNSAGAPIYFGYQKTVIPMDWEVKWYAWDPASVASPKDKMPAFDQVAKGDPLKTEKTDHISYAWGGSPGAPVPADHFLTLATGIFTVPAGKYSLEVTMDDGARVYVDGKLVIDQWHYQGPTMYPAPLQLTEGQHTIRIEHFEIDGYSALKVTLKPTH